MNIKNVVGQTFGKLEAFERFRENGITWYRCRCACGNVCKTRYTSLCAGTQSCGCLLVESRYKRKQSDETVHISKRWAGYRYKAQKRGFLWKLSKPQFVQLVTGACNYCGFEYSGGVDRIDSDDGYVIENCASCCKWCNWAKNERPLEDFKKWTDKVYANFHHKR